MSRFYVPLRIMSFLVTNPYLGTSELPVSGLTESVHASLRQGDYYFNSAKPYTVWGTRYLLRIDTY